MKERRPPGGEIRGSPVNDAKGVAPQIGEVVGGTLNKSNHGLNLGHKRTENTPFFQTGQPIGWSGPQEKLVHLGKDALNGNAFKKM